MKLQKDNVSIVSEKLTGQNLLEMFALVSSGSDIQVLNAYIESRFLSEEKFDSQHYITEVSGASGSSLICTTQYINTLVSNNGYPKIMSIKCWIPTKPAPKTFSINGHNGKGGAALSATVTAGKTYSIDFKSTKANAPAATITKTFDNDYILLR